MIGHGWLAVAGSAAVVAAVARTGAGGPGGSGLGPFRSSSHRRPRGSGGPGGSGVPVLGGGTGAIFGALLQSAGRVSGPWGSGHLLRTSLVSVLITSQGRILIGAVTPGRPLPGRHAARAIRLVIRRQHAAVRARSK